MQSRSSSIGGTVKTTTKTTRNKRTKITIETERVWVIERPGPGKAWCAACKRLVTGISPEEVASLATRTQNSHCPLKIGKLHFIGSPSGLMLVCADSLLEQA